MEKNQTMKDLTHKDKANELWTTYRFALSIKNAPLGEQKDLIAKQCALIAVDEKYTGIINVIVDLKGRRSIDDKTFLKALDDMNTEWVELKSEIEKL